MEDFLTQIAFGAIFTLMVAAGVAIAIRWAIRTGIEEAERKRKNGNKEV